MEDIIKWPSKIDYWLLIMVFLVPTILIFEVLSGSDPTINVLEWLFGLIIIAITLFTMWISVWPCHYLLCPEHLEVICGKFIHKKIPYKDIHNISKTYNPLSAPALSLFRVKIMYRKSMCLISPTNRESFIRELEKRCGIKQ